MTLGGGLTDEIAKQAVGDSLKSLGGATLYRVAKQAAVTAGHEPPGPGDDLGLGRVDFKINDNLRSDAVRAHLYAPRIYADAPELFFGPFMQLGTYLKESGAPIGTVTAIAIDTVTDPSTYFLPGTAGILKGGAKFALPRVTSRLLEGGIKGLSGEALVHAAATELENIGKIAGVGEELLAAAKAGDHAAIKEIGVKALAGGNIPAEFVEGAKSLRRDAKALGTILTNAEKIQKIEKLGANDFLQGSLRARLEAGQVSLGGFVIPDNPFKHPLAFSRQIIGLSHEGDRFYFPASEAVAAGLEKVGAEKFLRPADFKALLPELDLARGIAAGDEATAAFVKGVFKDARLRPYQVAVVHEAMLAVNSAPNAREFQLLGYDSIKESVLKDLHREYLGLKPGQHAEVHEYEAFRDNVLKGMNGARAQADEAAGRITEQVLNEMTGKIRTIAEQAKGADKLDEAAVLSLQSQARRIFDSMRGIQTLKYESATLGSALAGRVNMGTLMSHVLNTGMADVLEGAYKRRGPRELARKALSDALEHPEWWEKGADGALRLTVERSDIPAESFLSKLLHDSLGNKATAGLETALRTEGLPPEITQLAEQMRQGFDSVGPNLVHEGVLPGTIAGYLPHTFRGNEKFYKTFKLMHGQEGAFAEDILSQGFTGDARIAAFLNGKDIKPVIEKMGQGKASFQEARKLTEQLAVQLEAGGYGKYERDAVNLYSGYMDSVNRALLFNRIANNPEALSPLLTVEHIVAEMGPEAAQGITNAMLAKDGVRRGMRSDRVPGYAKHLFVDITGRPRATLARDSVEALASTTVRDAALKDSVGARAAVGDALRGKTEIGRVKLIDKTTGKPVPFDPMWVETGKYPQNLKNWKSVKTAVEKQLPADVARASKKLDARVAKDTATASRTISVFTPDHGHLAEAFRLFNRKQYDSNLIRALDRWNYRLKSVKLSMDIFHYNVLAVGSFALNPTDILKYMRDDVGALLPGVKEGAFGERLASATVLKKAVIGGAAGAGLAAGTGNEDKALPFSVAGAIYGGMLGAAKRSALRGYKMMLSPENADTLLHMGLGGWSGRPDDRAIGAIQSGLHAAVEALSKDPVRNRFLIHPIDGTRHIIDAFDHQLWGILHNGSKHYYFATRWERELPKLMESAAFKAADEAGQHLLKVDLAKQLVQAGNQAFGGMTWRYILKKPETQHLLRQALLSPDWTTARMSGAATVMMNLKTPQRVALGAAIGTATDFLQYGGDETAPRWRGPILGGLMGAGLGAFADSIAKKMVTKGDVLAKESRRLYSTAIIGGLLSMEAMNLALSGHAMHENPKGKKLSVDLGDGSFMPLGKPFVETLEFAGIYDPEKHPIPIFSRAKSKGAALPITAINLLTNDDGFAPIIAPDDYLFTADAKHSALIKVGKFAADTVLPIGVSGPARLAGEAIQGKAGGPQVQRALLRTAGFTTSSIPGLEQVRKARLDFSSPPLRLPGLGSPTDIFTGSLR